MSAFSKTEEGDASRRRIVALWFPYLAADRVLRKRWGRSWRSANPVRGPLIISHRESNTQRICALDEQAEALHLKRGMGIADARAMHPGIEIVEAEPDADKALLDGLADWCDRYTPLVALDGVDGLFLDISGCAHLFGGERAMLNDIAKRLLGQGFCVKLGAASTPGGAWAAARFSNAAILTPKSEAAFLAPLSLSALRLAPELRERLEGVGLRRVGMLLQAPRAPLARRFGKGLLLRLDQALGAVEEAISPRLPVAPLSVERFLPEPLVRMEDVEHLLGLLANTLKGDLERRGEGARRLELRLFRVDGLVSRIAVGAARPLRDPHLILKLFRERLAVLGDQVDAGYGFDLVRLSAALVAPYDDRQADLVDSTGDEGEGIAHFADRVRARYGPETIVRPVLVESHIPEHAVTAVAVEDRVEAVPIQDERGANPERPIRLLQHPELLQVSAEVPEGPPIHFRWRSALHKVARSEGPERIAPEWWRDRADAETRDYFRIEDTEGRRFWLFRRGFYGTAARPPAWFMHGLFP